MPAVARSRLIGASADSVWRLVADPHNLPRWWPETTRVEDVQGDPGARRSRFTQVLTTSKGRTVRADFRCTEATRGRRIVWSQELEGTPFEGFLREAEVELRLDDADPRAEAGSSTSVTVEGRRRLRGMSRLGSLMMRRATGRTLNSALDGIERAVAAGGERVSRTRDLLRRDAAFDLWGAEADAAPLSDSTRALLSERLGTGEPLPRVRLDSIDLPDPRPIPGSVVAAAGGADAVSADAEDRIRHSAGKGYPDLIRMRTRRLDRAPDAVLAPAGADSVASILAASAAEGVAVVPFGGGTSVVGGVEPDTGSFDRVVSLDLTAMRSVDVDPVSMIARLGPGLRGPEAEEALNARGFTLGHFPQSYRYATIGGFAATRSAGQASSGYGRFDALATAIELTAPAGRLRTLDTPHTAAGPSLRELVLGSEGTLGVITDVSVRIRPLPARKRYEGWMAPGFAAGIEIVKALAQEGELPDVVRLSDRDETEVSLAMAGMEGLRKSAFEGYLRMRGRTDGCVLIVGWEGEDESVERRRQLSRRILRRGAAVPLGGAPGRSWERGRFEGPHLRDALIGAGVLVETLETSHTYARLGELHAAVHTALEKAIAAGGAGGIVMCHVSHVYRDGASLYFTFLTPAHAGAEIEQWRGLKRAACDAIVATEGTITHHHAVGRDHLPYMPAEIGELGIDALLGVKERLDPAGIMNPGKLVAAS